MAIAYHTHTFSVPTADAADLLAGTEGGKVITPDVLGPVTAAGKALLSAANAGAQRAALDLEPGTDVQAYDADLTALAGLDKSDGNVIVGNGSTWVAENGDTARTSLGLGSAAVANLLDEDDMASDSATAVPSQQSVNVGKLQKVATRTAMRALSTSVHSVVYLSESGRAGVFVFNSSDLSLLVTNDPGEILYVAPGSDATGASGAWARQRDNLDIIVDWAGTVHDGTTNDYTAIQRAINLLEYLGGVGVLRFGGYSYASATQLRVKKGIIIEGVGSGTVSTNAALQSGTTQIVSTAAAGGILIQAANDLEMVNFPQVKNLAIDCSNTGQYGLFLASTQWALVENVQTRRCTVAGFCSDDSNNAYSLKGTFRNCFYIAGANAACVDSDGFHLTSAAGTTQVQKGTVRWTVDSCEAWVVDGDGIFFGGCDNNKVIGKWATYVSGTGRSAYFGTGGSSIVARNNTIDYLAGETVYFDANTYGNFILDGVSEGGGIDGDTTARYHYRIRDYIHADVFQTVIYCMSDHVDVPAGAFHAHGTNCTMDVAASLYGALKFAEAGNGSASCVPPIPINWPDGTIAGVTFFCSTGGANTSDTAHIQTQWEQPSAGGAIATPDLTETVALAVNDTANRWSEQTLTLASPISYSRARSLLLNVTRKPGEADDTVTGDLFLFKVRFHFKAEGPDSSAGTWGVPTPYKT